MEFEFTPIEYPNSVWTEANGIAWTGPLHRTLEIVGTYGDASGATHGFVHSGGNYTPLDVPNQKNTTCNGINARGQIVGTFDRLTPFPEGNYSFVYENGAWTACTVTVQTNV